MDIPSIIIQFFINIIPIVSAIYIVAGCKFVKNKKADRFDYFSLFMFAVALYSFGYYLEITVQDSDTAFFLRNFQYLGVCLIPATAFLFSFQITKVARVSMKLAIPFILLSMGFWLLFVTDPLHHLFYKNIVYFIGKYGGTMVSTKGPVYRLLLAYFGAALFSGSLMLLSAWLKATKTKRRSSMRFMFLSYQIAWIPLSLITFGMDRYVDPTPMTIMIICLLFVINEMHNGVFELQLGRWENIFKDVGEAAVLVDEDGDIICRNTSASRLLAEAKNDMEACIEQVRSNGATHETVFFPVNKSIRWYEVRKSVFDEKKGLVTCLLVDLTGEVKSSLVAESFFNSIEDFIFIAARSGEVLFVNDEVKKRLFYSDEEIAKMSVLDFRFAENREEMACKFDDIQAVSEIECAYPLITKYGEIIPVETRVWTGQWNGKPVIYCMSRDVTEREIANEKIRNSEEQFRRLISQMQQGLAVHEIILDEDGTPVDYRFISANKSFERITLMKVDEIIGKTVREVIPDIDSKWIAIYGRVALTGEPVQLEDYIPAIDKYYSISAYSPRENQFAVIVSDITDKKRKEAEIEYLSYHDQLTGLNNRRYYELLIRDIDDRQYYPLTLVMADVNGLKLTNDAFGHVAGDALLSAFANLLKRECRASDHIFRIGGDEFIILLPYTNGDRAAKFIDRITKAISKIVVENVILSVSIGYAVKHDDKCKIDEIFKQAEDNMYRHKLSESSSMRSKTISLIMNSLYENNNREMLHSQRVSALCESIAKSMGYDKDDVNQMRIAGLMHDIGKIGISDTILNFPGKLNSDEWSEIHRHSEIGYRILSSVNEFSEIAEYVLQHHERWDGKGYPKKLRGDEISVQARIIAVADAFDAMTTDRAYRTAMSEEDAVVEIERQSGKQFDPQIVEVFLDKIRCQPQMK